MPTPEGPNRPRALLTVDDVAERLSVSKVSVRRWIRLGRLGAVSLGHLVRVREEDVEAFLAASSRRRSRSRRKPQKTAG